MGVGGVLGGNIYCRSTVKYAVSVRLLCTVTDGVLSVRYICSHWYSCSDVVAKSANYLFCCSKFHFFVNFCELCSDVSWTLH